jgi:hypothetical protein
MSVKKTLHFLMSLRVTLWLLSFVIVLLVGGALLMPVREEFQGIHSVPLFTWMVEQPLVVTWWLWASVIVLVGLTTNTILCSIESLVGKGGVEQWLLRISPQVIHLGFLFILFAHLASAMGSYRAVAVAREGTGVVLPDNSVLSVKEVEISADERGYLRDWAVNVELISGQGSHTQAQIKANRPMFHKKFGVYVRDLRAFPERIVLLEISREPGALWALIGGVLFVLGSVTLIIFKVRRDSPSA